MAKSTRGGVGGGGVITRNGLVQLFCVTCLLFLLGITEISGSSAHDFSDEVVSFIKIYI